MVNKLVVKNLLTIKQVSEFLSLHPNTVRRWCDEGRLHYLRITPRGDRRIRKEDIQRYLDKLNGIQKIDRRRRRPVRNKKPEVLIPSAILTFKF